MMNPRRRYHWLSLVGGTALVATGCVTTPPAPHTHTVTTQIPGASIQDVHATLITVIRGQQRDIVRDTTTRIEVTQRVANISSTDCAAKPEKQVYLIEPTDTGVTLSTQFYACDHGSHKENTGGELQFTEKRLSRELDAVKRLWVAKYAPPFQEYVHGALDPPASDAEKPAVTAPNADKKPRRTRSNGGATDR